MRGLVQAVLGGTLLIVNKKRSINSPRWRQAAEWDHILQGAGDCNAKEIGS